MPKPTRVSVKKSTPVTTKTAEEVVQVSAEQTKVAVDVKTTDAPKRFRARNREFTDLHQEMEGQLKSAYHALQSVVRSFSSLNSAHKREVNSKVHRDVTNRTPTTLFDKPLCNYFHARLSPDELVIERKQGDTVEKVDLRNLDSKTALYRTDLTKLYNRVFSKHDIATKPDKRIVHYTKDTDLVALLTTGAYDSSLESEVQQIRDGTLKLTIFNIQKYLNHHLMKVQ